MEQEENAVFVDRVDEMGVMVKEEKGDPPDHRELMERMDKMEKQDHPDQQDHRDQLDHVELMVYVTVVIPWEQ
jgi:hypothetical protein